VRAWEILNREPGLRTILDLHEDDGEANKRVKLLERTAAQFDVAGAAALGSGLREVLEHPWGTAATPESQAARSAFVDAAKQFMKPAKLRSQHHLPWPR